MDEDNEIKDDNILPYEGNEHLVGTDDNPEEEIILKEGEYYWFSNNRGMPYPEIWVLRQLERIEDEDFVAYNDYTENRIFYHHAIKQSDFNPNNMEETLKHIINVKNGKPVRK